MLFVVVNGLSNTYNVACSQPCHLNCKKQIYQKDIIGLKIATGRRQTSCLLTSMTDELNQTRVYRETTPATVSGQNRT